MIDYAKVPSPAYVLDEARLRRNLELIQHVQQESGASVILALKGFSMWRVFPMVKQYLAGATASSLHEARLIFEEMGVPAHTYSPAYLPAQFEEVMGYSSHITFNSIAQYARYREQLQQAKQSISPGLRVNPEFSVVETDLYNPSAPGSRLGEMVENLGGKLPEGIEGLHIHTLCESSAEDLENLIKSVEQRFGAFFPQLQWINFGGGHLMTRQGYDVERLIKVLQAFRARHPQLEVILEPGSAIAWETGELVTTVLDVINSRGIKTAILDVSFTAHMPDTLEMPYRPKVLGATDPVDGKPTYRLGGSSCLAGDFMTEYSFEQELKPGDRLVLWDMIHYTMVKTTTFNGVKHPDICIWHEDDTLEVVKKYEYEDFRNRLS
ncbi:carboxynorspermidine decarboxylase [Haliscomenobacter hydrossis]|uniref:Carboxynorspermidine/carboxyspermidine decarboxylase n=1 Tax=Haliscomenobacter hydrossis (strain ATCC 27775 / DSM 1100 / LMG 10767 / O) TaxID=760192 RepID=F4L7H4_HALH1|nr:carboxynorspermidine decarboxylase [Haliscomenobacter hydrossis]AEE54154.1 carboxynorspermidine decarboxylase [Haliscomenobacter hydrossis DSM 1100]